MRDYKLLASNVPALFADVEIGHIGTYYQMNGGKMGKAAVKFFDWQLKGNMTAKAEFCSKTSSLTGIGFKIESKNGLC